MTACTLGLAGMPIGAMAQFTPSTPPAVTTPAGVAAPQNAPGMPSLDSIFDNAAKALGGKSAIEKLKTMHAKGNVEFAGQKILVEHWWSKAGGRISKTSLPGMGEMTSGTDGTVYWTNSMAGYTIVSKDEADAAGGMSGMHMGILDPRLFAKDQIKTMAVVGKEQFRDAECYKVKQTKGGQDTFIYYNVKTGMPMGFESPANGMQPRMTMTIDEWKTIEGVKFFHLLRMQGTDSGPELPDGMRATPSMGEVKFDTIEVNTVKDDVFALPDEVKALAKDAAAGGGAGGEIALSDLSAEQQKQATEMVENLKKSGVDGTKGALPSLERAAKMMPDSTPQKKMFQYVVQELQKFVAGNGG
ncbi:MAG: hypothetical protein IPK69_00645 [Phycisphaerales bacterium]|nr:MAG: hypothetical protein IPK69_00645 [Phycisphaerales bacterium]